MGRVCNDFRLNYPLSYHQRIQSCAFLLQGAKPSANTAILETKLGIEMAAIKNLFFFICSASHLTQNIDKKLPLSDIASAKGITVDDLLTEIETIVDSGTKINLSYLINEILEDCQIEELDEVLTESDEASFQELREEFDEDEYTDEELRMSRIQFISHMGN